MSDINKIISNLNQFHKDDENRRKKAEWERHDAILRTADSVESVDSNLSQLSTDLEQERTERKKSDDENMVYTKNMDKKNNRLAWIGIIIGGLALFLEIFGRFFP